MSEVVINKKVIVFQLDNEKYGFDINYVRSIEKVLPVTEIPQVSEFILGVVNLRGVIIPVMDLKKRLGRGETRFSGDTRILVMNFNGVDIGLLVDSANDVMDINCKTIDSGRNIMVNDNESFIEGIAKLDSLVVLLNLEPIVNLNELSDLRILESFNGKEEVNDSCVSNR